MEPSEFPSPLTQVFLNGKKSKNAVLVPSKELFRVKTIFEEHEYRIGETYLSNASKIIVDVGANVGLFALYMAMTQAVDVMHCFEPTPSSVDLLKRNLGGHENIHIHPIGLSDFTGSAFLNLHPKNSGQNTIAGEKSADGENIEIPIHGASDAFEQLGLSYIDILKIDTEGCEVQILENLGPRLSYVGIVLLEYHSEADRRTIDGLLNGFTLIGAKAEMMNCGILKYINRKLL